MKFIFFWKKDFTVLLRSLVKHPLYTLQLAQVILSESCIIRLFLNLYYTYRFTTYAPILRKTGNIVLLLDTLILFQMAFKTQDICYQTNLFSKFHKGAWTRTLEDPL